MSGAPRPSTEYDALLALQLQCLEGESSQGQEEGGGSPQPPPPKRPRQELPGGGGGAWAGGAGGSSGQPRPVLAPSSSAAAVDANFRALIASLGGDSQDGAAVPDIRELFLAYDRQFFYASLGAVEVKWSKRMTLCAGLCRYEGRGGMCSISLSEPLLKFRPRSDMRDTLLHEMIHAYLFVTGNNRDRTGHGPEFQSHMNRINDAYGSKITVYHTFHDEVDHYRRHVWRCDGPCRQKPPYYGFVKRAMNRAPGAYDWWWADHSATCGGTYHKIASPEPSGGTGAAPSQPGQRGPQPSLADSAKRQGTLPNLLRGLSRSAGSQQDSSGSRSGAAQAGSESSGAQAETAGENMQQQLTSMDGPSITVLGVRRQLIEGVKWTAPSATGSLSGTRLVVGADGSSNQTHPAPAPSQPAPEVISLLDDDDEESGDGGAALADQRGDDELGGYGYLYTQEERRALLAGVARAAAAAAAPSQWSSGRGDGYASDRSGALSTAAPTAVIDILDDDDEDDDDIAQWLDDGDDAFFGAGIGLEDDGEEGGAEPAL